ncbi:SRPBCC domain-containing protein [Phytomonospora sp. NPDC050363]|uniref:SRPBCC family protein n=1 Tax=Phytomonospora sp. NPDC050363 TaxID=3155642 RepID=UPI0033F07DC7
MSTDTETMVLTRVFAAPRELVYRAFTDPEQIAQWFGPVGWSVPRDTISVAPHAGGGYKMTMVSDEDPSMASPIDSTFSEVVENELMIGSEVFEGRALTMKVEFADADGGTRITITQGPFSREMAEMTREGWESSFTKLDALLKA